MNSRRGFSFCLLLVLGGAVAVAAESPKAADGPPAAAPKPLAAVLPPEKWRQLENSVDRGLAWIASQQAADGSFPTIPQGQPAVTSLCVMAFLSRGHQPGVGPYGGQLNRAIDYVLSCQLPDGLFSKLPPELVYARYNSGHTASYNHAVSGLMLGEVYGQVTGQREKNVKAAIGRALVFSRALQTRPKAPPETGGWRYTVLAEPTDSDLSVTVWQLMFLRSAKNAEFDVSEQYVEEALAYVRRTWDSNSGSFFYTITGASAGNTSRGLAGVGIVALAMAGKHQTDMALAAGNYLLARPFKVFGEVVGTRERFFYSTFYCSQAAAQLGGRYWEGIFPPLVDVLLKAQAPDGSWPPEVGGVAIFGNALTTAMAVLSLTPPYQLLPVYQR